VSAVDTQNPGDANPAGYFFAITPSDDTNFVQGETRGIYVGGSGDIVAVGRHGVAKFIGVVAGTILSIRVIRVNETETTAQNLVGLY